MLARLLLCLQGSKSYAIQICDGEWLRESGMASDSSKKG